MKYLVILTIVVSSATSASLPAKGGSHDAGSVHCGGIPFEASRSQVDGGSNDALTD